MKLSLTLAATLFAGLLSSTANAVTDTVTINLSGTLTRPPCTLTSSKTLTANFGSLRYDQVADAALPDPTFEDAFIRLIESDDATRAAAGGAP